MFVFFSVFALQFLYDLLLFTSFLRENGFFEHFLTVKETFEDRCQIWSLGQLPKVRVVQLGHDWCLTCLCSSPLLLVII